MDLLQTVVLAILQGLTEFLPISSSAHLILIPKLLGWPDQGLAFDVAVHVGSLAAVLVYFKSDVLDLIKGWRDSVFDNVHSEASNLAWCVIVATLPIFVFGFIVNGWFVEALREPLLIASATVIFGLLLWWADRVGAHNSQESGLTVNQALIIGCAQALALIPGTSRSGITITAALALGLTRTAAARFSFLLSIPVILVAGLVKTAELLQSADQVAWWPMLLGTLLSGITAYLCIHYFLALIERVGLFPFVVYRLLLGAVLLYFYL